VRVLHLSQQRHQRAPLALRRARVAAEDVGYQGLFICEVTQGFLRLCSILMCFTDTDIIDKAENMENTLTDISGKPKED